MKTIQILGLLALLLQGDRVWSETPRPPTPPRAAAPRGHAITVRIALAVDADGEHVTFKTQNGSTVSLARRDLVGKSVMVATTPGGEPAANAEPIDAVKLTLGADLTASYTTPASYADGAWEVSCVIVMTDSPRIPAAGDLAAFDNSPTPSGEEPPTGASVRVRVRGSGAHVTLTNRYFIRFAA